MPGLLDTGGCDCVVERLSLLTARWHFRLIYGRWNNLSAMGAGGCHIVQKVTASSFRGRETNFFSSNLASDSSTPWSRHFSSFILPARAYQELPFNAACTAKAGAGTGRQEAVNTRPVHRSPQRNWSTKIRAWLPRPMVTYQTFCGYWPCSWSALCDLVEE